MWRFISKTIAVALLVVALCLLVFWLILPQRAVTAGSFARRSLSALDGIASSITGLLRIHPDLFSSSISNNNNHTLTLSETFIHNTSFPKLIHQYQYSSSLKEVHGDVSSRKEVQQQGAVRSVVSAPHTVFMDKWKLMYPDWRYVLWTDDGYRRFLQDYYPWFLRFYDRYRKEEEEQEQRAEVMSYFIMLHFGGIFADSHVEPLRSLEPLLRTLNGQAVVAYVTANYSNVRSNIGNAFLASSPSHNFWWTCIAEMISDYQRGTLTKEQQQQQRTSKTTGIAAQLYCDQSKQLGVYTGACPDTGQTRIHDLSILAPELIYPYDPSVLEQRSVCAPDSSAYNEKQCRELFPSAYTLAH